MRIRSDVGIRCSAGADDPIEPNEEAKFCCSFKVKFSGVF